MTEVTILVEDINPTLKVAHISGQLDESNVDEKIQGIYKTLENAPKGLSMIFDMQNLDYMNSKSIGYLTDLYGKITELGGKVAICSAKPNILDILQVVGLTQLMQNYESLDSAKAALNTTATTTPAPTTAQAVQPAQTTVAPQTPVAEPAPTVQPSVTPVAQPTTAQATATTVAPVEPAVTPAQTPATVEPAVTPAQTPATVSTPVAQPAPTPPPTAEPAPTPAPADPSQVTSDGAYKFES
ncbi:MAG: STAS domain-containing protein [Candidatus Peregrinibacteria bacterium]|nr:STAS domain-containing protein [Candidatus Peregrinibacteria bacterium]